MNHIFGYQNMCFNLLRHVSSTRMGESMENFCNANNGVPALGCAYDGGLSNSALNRTLLGLKDPYSLKDLAFWKHLRVRPLKVVPLCNCGIPVYQQKSPGGVREYPVLGCNDSRHVLKRFTAQHFLGTRTIYHGCLPVDALVMLRNKMPLKTFALRDEMSDQASWQRLCPRFLDASWASAAAEPTCCLAAS